MSKVPVVIGHLCLSNISWPIYIMVHPHKIPQKFSKFRSERYAYNMLLIVNFSKRMSKKHSHNFP